MKKRRIFVFLIVFFLLGEVLVRIDKSFDILNEKAEVEIKIKESALKQKVDSGGFVLEENQYRVLVLGDSYFFGAGIDPQFKMSNHLQKELQKKLNTTKKVLVLDVSRASNNTLDNYNLFKFYNKKFQPNTVVLGYNFNDIIGDLSIKKEVPANNEVVNSSDLITVKKDNNLKSLSKRIYNTSELLRFISAKTQKELKLKGIVIPFGEFYYLIEEAYKSSNKNWIQSQEIISKMDEECTKDGIRFIFYKLPEFNLLKKNSLFEKVDSSLEGYLRQKPTIHYIDGHADFEKDGDFMLSKYDGHPNKLAHQVISERIVKEIIDRKLFLTFDR
ncbi:MAG: hypothetical protein JXR05_10560 [Flavobacteriaceae bacterium]